MGSLVMVAGPSGNYKSFLAIDWTLSLASGREWNGRKTVPSKVLYVLGEGKGNMFKRLEAWMTHQELNLAERTLINESFRVTFEVPQFADKASVDNMLAALTVEQFKPSVIVIDTFARSFVGMDENDAKDTGLWIESADRLRQLGCTVIFLHHTAKNTEFGVKYRGSTAIMGAMDSSFNMVKEKEPNLAALTCTKQKDHDDHLELFFRRTPVGDDNEEGSMILVPTLKMDAQFSRENHEREEKIKLQIPNLLANNTYRSDADRAKALASATGLTEIAAQSRIYRARQRVNG